MSLPVLPSTFSQDRRSGLALPNALLRQRQLQAAAEFRAATASRIRSGWNLGRTNTTPAEWTLQTLREYSRDLNRNDPVASGATETMATNIVGRGLQPQAKLRAAMLGISDDQARELQRQAELIWETWAPRADSGNRLNFSELQFLVLRKVVEDGEALALPVMVSEPGRPLERAVELLEADRLTGVGAETQTGRETGVDVGLRGEPAVYNFTKVDPTRGLMDYGGATERLAARDEQGRPRVLHIFRANRPGQMRGVPFFAPVITYFQDLADFLEARVVTAKVAAFLSVFITRTESFGGAGFATDTEAGTAQSIEDLELGEIRYLKAGEAVNVIDPNRGGDTFAGFVEEILRIIGASLGLPYELLLKDFSKTNYSSARAAILEGRRMFMNWRGWLAAKFCQPIWELVLEEAYLRGLWPVPKFYEHRTEYLRAAWMGPGWGWVDPTKEVAASINAIQAGLSTHTKELAHQGEDCEETFDQLAAERDYATNLGLSFIAPKARIAPPEAPMEEVSNAPTK